jgi:predicted RNase H-like nuclease (RuvC/YqgF family)
MAVEDTILQKIWRDFSPVEAIQFSQKVIKELKFEIGVLKSDLTECQDKNSKLRSELHESKQGAGVKKKKQYEAEILGLENHVKKLQNALYESNKKITINGK